METVLDSTADAADKIRAYIRLESQDDIEALKQLKQAVDACPDFAEGISKISQLDKQQCNAIGAAAREKILAMCSKENTLDRLVQLIESDL